MASSTDESEALRSERKLETKQADLEAEKKKLEAKQAELEAKQAELEREIKAEQEGSTKQLRLCNDKLAIVQQINTIGQQINTIGQQFNTIGQQFSTIGQQFSTLQQGINIIQQGINEITQITARFTLQAQQPLLRPLSSRRSLSDQATSTDTQTTQASRHSGGGSLLDKDIVCYSSTAFVPTSSGAYDPKLRKIIIGKLSHITNLHYKTRWARLDERLGVLLEFDVMKESAEALFKELSVLDEKLKPTSQWRGYNSKRSSLRRAFPPTHCKNSEVTNPTSSVSTGGEKEESGKK